MDSKFSFIQFTVFEEFLVFWKELVINEDTCKGIEGSIMDLGFPQGSSIPVGSLLVFGEFAIEQFQTQK